MQGAEVNTVEINTVECKEKYCVYVEENTVCRGQYCRVYGKILLERILQSAEKVTVECKGEYCRGQRKILQVFLNLHAMSTEFSSQTPRNMGSLKY